MRLALLALLATTACVQTGARVAEGNDDASLTIRSRPDIDSARELDQQGVRAFREGRYADAIRYFRAAYRLGGPSSELWNIARSRERMDDAETAASAIEQYLAQRDLSAQDRADAEHELAALRTRVSILTVTTVPAGAVVVIDGKQTLGPTPLSVELHAGPHTLSVHHDGYATETRPLEARFGRAVILSLDLARQAGDKR
jgi:hypothetical protein